MKSVFVLQHLHFLADGEESVCMIGVYSSLSSAKEAVKRLNTKSGFSDFPEIIDPSLTDQEEGFYIDEYIIDEDNWKEGFIRTD